MTALPKILAPLLLLPALFLIGCDRTAPTPAVKSPDGSMSLSTGVNQSKDDPTRYLCVIVEIKDAAGKLLHREVTPASDTHKWSIRWQSNDHITLTSSDVGSYQIRRQADGRWKGELAKQ